MAQESRELDMLELRRQQLRGRSHAPRMTPDFVIDVSRWARDNAAAALTSLQSLHNAACYPSATSNSTSLYPSASERPNPLPLSQQARDKSAGWSSGTRTKLKMSFKVHIRQACLNASAPPSTPIRTQAATARFSPAISVPTA
jgi:hypothetical protein